MILRPAGDTASVRPVQRASARRPSHGFGPRRDQPGVAQACAIGGSAHLDLVRRIGRKSPWNGCLEAAQPVAKAGIPHIRAFDVRHGHRDRHAVIEHLQPDRMVRIGGVARPPDHAVGRHLVNVAGQRPARIARALCPGAQPHADGFHREPLLHAGRAVAWRRNRRLGIQGAVFGCVVEHAAAAVVHERFRRRAFGQDRVVRVQLQVHVVHALDVGVLDHRNPIHQQPGRDQDAVQQHRVEWRDREVPERNAIGEAAGSEPDWQQVRPAPEEPPGIAAPPDPPDWPHRARRSHDTITDGEVFNGTLAAVGQDPRAGAVARDRLLQQDRPVRLDETGACRGGRFVA